MNKKNCFLFFNYKKLMVVFRILVFFRIRIELYFLSPDPDRPNIRIRYGKIRIHEKNVLKLQVQVEIVIFHIKHSQHCSFWSGYSKTQL